MTCLTCDSTPIIARIEPDLDMFSQIEEKRRNFEALVRANAMRVSKSDLSQSTNDRSDPNIPEQPPSR